MSKRIFPADIIPGTARAWKTRKRRELDAVIAAMETFLLGAAYTPATEWTIPELNRLKDMRKKFDVARWGR